MKHRILRKAINEAIIQMLRDIAIESGQLPALASLDRYLPMPKEDFRAMSRLTEPEWQAQHRAAVAAAVALLKFKQNSSYYPEYRLPVIHVGG